MILKGHRESSPALVKQQDNPLKSSHPKKNLIENFVKILRKIFYSTSADDSLHQVNVSPNFWNHECVCIRNGNFYVIHAFKM